MITKLFNSIDGMDAVKFASFLTEDASFTFGNQPTVRGRQNIEKFVAGFFTSIKKLEHKLTKSAQQNDTVICEGVVTYTRLDTKIVSIPFANFLEMSGDKIHNYKIYIDPTPLFAI